MRAEFEERNLYERTALGLIKFLSGRRATQVQISRFLFKSLEKSAEPEPV